MTNSEARDRINEEAAAWAARNALSEQTDEQVAQLEAWLAADRRHAGAYLRARAAFIALEDAALANPIPAASNDDEPEPLAAPRRLPRRLLGSGLAAAAYAVVLAVSVPAWRASTGHDDHSLTLADGSSVVLGDDGRIASAIDGSARRITLESGSATFHVAKDRRRPFIVRSGRVYAEATGTVYSVRRVNTAGGAVEVTEGTVRVWAEGARDKAVMLHAGNKLTLDPAAATAVTTVSPAAQGFWFDETSIAEAAERFNQVNATRIVIADPAIGKVAIMGRFKPDRPDEFAKAAAAVTGGRVTRREGTLVIDKK